MPEPLDYFSPQEPDRKRGRGVIAASVVLLGSWLPYLCGIVNASTVARSYVPEITRAHLNATIILFAAGLLLAGASFVWFARLRHAGGAITAAMIVLVQTIVVACIGLAR